MVIGAVIYETAEAKPDDAARLQELRRHLFGSGQLRFRLWKSHGDY